MNNVPALRIGWASRDITPAGKVNLGGQYNMRITRDVKDPITVTALAMSSGQDPANSVIFLSGDLLMFPGCVVDDARKKLAAKVNDFPVKNLVLNATHPHTAPDIQGVYDYDSLSAEEAKDLIRPEAYREFLADKIAEAAAESWQNRREGSIAWGIGFAVVGHNRRTVYLKDFSERPDYQETPGWEIKTNAKMYGTTNDPWFSHMEGYEDHSVQFLFTFDRNQKLTGSVINLACPSQETECLSEVTADFWHDVRVALREKYGPGLYVLPQCAAAGDQSPHLLLNQKAEVRRLQLKGIDSRREIAGRIAAAFDETFAWAKQDIQTTVPFQHQARTVELPKREVTEDEYRQNAEWLRQYEAGKLELPGLTHWCCQKVVKDFENQKKNGIPVCPAEIHVVRLGEIVFATNPFELYLDYGVRIQARSPATQTFIVQLAGKGEPNGGTYLPAARSEKGGGYSACVYSNPVGAPGGQVLVEETLKTITDLWTA